MPDFSMTETSIPTISANHHLLRIDHPRALFALLVRKYGHDSMDRVLFWSASPAQVYAIESLAVLVQVTVESSTDLSMELRPTRRTFCGQELLTNVDQAETTLHLYDKSTQELIGRIDNLAVPLKESHA